MLENVIDIPAELVEPSSVHYTSSFCEIIYRHMFKGNFLQEIPTSLCLLGRIFIKAP